MFEFYPPEVGKCLKEKVRPLVLSEGQWSGEVALINVKGRKTSTIQNIYLLCSSSGDALCFAYAITDISEHVCMEERLRIYRDQLEHFIEERVAELQKSERAFHIIFEASTGPMCVVKNRTITAINSAMARSIGYNQDELLNVSTKVVYADEKEYQ